jgi:hypothetical protein
MSSFDDADDGESDFERPLIAAVVDDASDDAVAN